MIHPDRWLVIDALEAHTEGHRRLVDRIGVVDVCPDGASAFQRYRELHGAHPERELYFVHTGNADLDIVERSWLGIRRSDAPQPAG